MLFDLHEKLAKSFWWSLSRHISAVLCITISVKYGKEDADENQNETKPTQSVLSDSVVGGTLNKPRGWICSLIELIEKDAVIKRVDLSNLTPRDTSTSFL